MSKERPKGFTKNSLDAYQEQIIDMRNDGYSYKQIVDLLSTKGVIVHSTTVNRFILKQK